MPYYTNTLFLDDCYVVLLAAGNSSRMGKPKFTLAFDDKHIFLEKIIEGYITAGITKIIVVINPRGFEILKKEYPTIFNLAKIVVNNNQNSSRFHSLQIGLKNINNAEACFIHNVDNPFVNIEILHQLLSQAHQANIIAPGYKDKGGHPILLSKKVLKAIEQETQSDSILSDFLNQFKKLKITTQDPKILTNINTQEAYEDFLKNKTTD